MKSKEFYHTEVKCIDYTQFPKYYIKDNDDKDLIISLVKSYNKEHNIIDKLKIAYQLPQEIFCKCRICGNIIVNSNFEIKYDKLDNSIYHVFPAVYCREIDGKKYYLSCCEKCLLEHFKDCLPKASKYYYMKGNKYGCYSFGYSYEEYKKLCSMTTGVTQKSMIRKWGEEEGNKRWKLYCNKQSETNTFEYKQEKHGWDKDKFKEFNKSRAVTENNLIKKHGLEKGIEIFNTYCEKQRITKSYDYMVKKYGKEKADKINKSKALTVNNYIAKYGEDEGIERFNKLFNRHQNFYSKISQKLFRDLDEILAKKYTTYFATKNYEKPFICGDNTYCLDYYIEELNICIEYNGSIFHGDPRLFLDDDKPNPWKKNLTAKDIRNIDNIRYNLLYSIYGIKTYVIWELDYNKNFDINKYITDTLKIKI